MQYTITVHIIQKAIINLLRKHETLRYSELLPADIESSHFKYHLDQLIRQGLVEQRGKGVYALSLKGQSVTDRMSIRPGSAHETPKVITYTLIRDNEAVHLLRKDKQPFLGRLGLIGGKLHVGEEPKDAALREVKEKINVTLADLDFHGIANIAVLSEKTLVSHAVAYIFSAPYAVAMPGLERIDKDSLVTRDDLSPDLLALIEAISSHESPFVISIRSEM